MSFCRNKRLSILIAFLLMSLGLNAQTVTELWITGSAVPDGVQKLTAFPDGKYKYAGTLMEGEVKVMTTETPQAGTYYLAPDRVDSYVVNHGLPYSLTNNANKDGWQVTFDEDRYRFTVDTRSKTLTGELFIPWNELFIVGGCLSCGWEGHYFLPFTRVEGEMCTYTWTGEMREHSEFVEPRRFKITGQNAWEPKSLHPFVQDQNIMTSSQVCTGGPDNKWNLDQPGIYTIRVDVFRETINASYLGAE